LAEARTLDWHHRLKQRWWVSTSPLSALDERDEEHLILQIRRAWMICIAKWTSAIFEEALDHQASGEETDRPYYQAHFETLWQRMGS
jgi:hypothetical protein